MVLFNKFISESDYSNLQTDNKAYYKFNQLNTLCCMGWTM